MICSRKIPQNISFDTQEALWTLDSRYKCYFNFDENHHCYTLLTKPLTLADDIDMLSVRVWHVLTLCPIDYQLPQVNPGDRFTNGLWTHNQNLRKKIFAPMFYFCAPIRPQCCRAELSWHVRNCYLVRLLFSLQGQLEIHKDLGYEHIKRSWNGSKHEYGKAWSMKNAASYVNWFAL